MEKFFGRVPLLLRALVAGSIVFALTTPALAVPEIDVQQPADSSIPDGGSTHFGSPAVGASSALTFLIRNTGTTALSLTGAPPIAIGGPNAAEFTVTVPPAASVAAGALSITNSGFETPAQAANEFTYAPSGSSWTFGSSAGIARNGSPWFVNAAPEGVQAAFVQGTTAGASLSRVFSFPNTGSYVIRFSMVRRNASLPANDIAVQMDGATLRAITNTEQPDDVWRTFLVPYQCTVAGNHTLAFLGMRSGGDYASAIDAVQIVGATTFEVTFSPAATGARTASLSIANNDSNENPYNITLTGSPGLATVYAVTMGTDKPSFRERWISATTVMTA